MLKNSKVCFISVTLKSWSGRKLLDPTTYMHCRQNTGFVNVKAGGT